MSLHLDSAALRSIHGFDSRSAAMAASISSTHLGQSTPRASTSNASGGDVGILQSAQSTPRASGHAPPASVSVEVAGGSLAGPLPSATMSLHTSTHSSQMQALGPAISLRTCSWVLLQKEHRRICCSHFFIGVVGFCYFAYYKVNGLAC